MKVCTYLLVYLYINKIEYKWKWIGKKSEIIIHNYHCILPFLFFMYHSIRVATLHLIETAVVTLYVANATICRKKRHYMSQTPLYVATCNTICRKPHYMLQKTPLYVATQYVARKYKIDTICRKL